jgi:hypothetical protein
VLFELFPVVTGRGTPRGVRGPPHFAEPSSAAPQGYRAAGRLRAAPGVESGVTPPSSPSPTTASPLSAALWRRAKLRPLRGLHDYLSVFTTSWSSRLPVSTFIPIVATLQRLEGVAVDVLTSRTWFCRSSLRAV